MRLMGLGLAIGFALGVWGCNKVGHESGAAPAEVRATVSIREECAQRCLVEGGIMQDFSPLPRSQRVWDWCRCR